MWGGVFETSASDIMKQINASIGFDYKLYKHDIQGSIAHAEMLARQKIITHSDFELIQNGLKQIHNEIESGKFTFSTELEDIHMNIESRLIELIGDAGKRLHTGRSRNDQVATDFKMYVRDAFTEIKTALSMILTSLVKKAESNADYVMPSFTHLQIAQPISIGHYLLAYSEMFLRDIKRIDNAIGMCDECPLGSAALAGTTYDIDRSFTAQALGFAAPTRNSIDSVSDRDFALEFLFICSVIATHLSRFAEEIVIFCTNEFGYISLSDKFTTGSSIMPQKRNPDAAELVRGKVGRNIGNLVSLLVTIKGLPLAYSKDMQEDKEPVFDSHENIILCLRAVNGMISDIQFNYARLEEMTENGYSTATDLADYLVQKLGIPFRDAHHVTGKIVKMAIDKKCKLSDLNLQELQKIEAKIENDIYKFIEVKMSVSRRTSFGGTAFNNVKNQIQKLREQGI